MKKWTKINSEIVFDNPHFKVRRDMVKLPNNTEKEWIYWDSWDSAMVIGMTENHKIVMIRQYRYLVENEVIQFASGGFEKHENPEEAAKREFLEETGYEASKLFKLGAFYETYGQLNRQIHLYFAPNVIHKYQHLDQGERGYEDIKVELVDFQEAVKLATENKIAAMGSTLAILLLQEKIKRGEITI